MYYTSSKNKTDVMRKKIFNRINRIDKIIYSVYDKDFNLGFIYLPVDLVTMVTKHIINSMDSSSVWYTILLLNMREIMDIKEKIFQKIPSSWNFTPLYRICYNNVYEPAKYFEDIIVVIKDTTRKIIKWKTKSILYVGTQIMFSLSLWVWKYQNLIILLVT